MPPNSMLQGDGFHTTAYHETRAFSSFLPGIAGEYGKPIWAFYCNRGQCITSFGVRDKNGAMLEFHPANKAYALTPLLGFRTFVHRSGDTTVYEPFDPGAGTSAVQRMCVRPHELEIEELHEGLGLRIRVVYFTLPGDSLPALVRRVVVENIGTQRLCAEVLDGLPEIVPYGLEERLLKTMSRTMEAFAEIRHVEEQLPFYKLKVEPSDKPEVHWIEGGFFTFTVRNGQAVPVWVDPELVFGLDTSLRVPRGFLREPDADTLAARRNTLTGCAFARISLALDPGASTGWDSYFGQASDWTQAQALRSRVLADAHFTSRKRNENAHLITQLGAQFALVAGPAQLDPYTRQAFLDNCLRGGQPVVVDGPRGARVFHTFSRKHGDMERDYNFFELAPTYFSQGNGNFRDVNQNRRCENYIFPAIGGANIETFFNLLQFDGNNPQVIESEKFRLPDEQLAALLKDFPLVDTPQWLSVLAQPFGPGQLFDMLVRDCGSPDMARPWFDRIIGCCDKIQGASHGEGYWVDHWIYNLDLLDSFAALYPDQLPDLLFERQDFTYFDSEFVVQPRSAKYQLRDDGSVRQLHAVVLDPDKAARIALRDDPARMARTGYGDGPVYHTTLMAKIVSLLAVKATLFDPSGTGLEMEAEKPGWCDALNGLPALFGSSTHEAFALQRWTAFVRAALHLNTVVPATLALPVEVASLLHDVTQILIQADTGDFFASWDRLASRREAFRAQTRLGIGGEELRLSANGVLPFLDAVDHVLAQGLARAVDADGLPVSYYTHALVRFEQLPAAGGSANGQIRPLAFTAQALAPFLEGSVHALRSAGGEAPARRLHQAVRRSALHDAELGMYRVNAPLDEYSFEIGRSRMFAPGWLENESIFLHMHYKFLLETLRSGLAAEFFDDLRTGLVAFHSPQTYGRSPLENSSFIASSRFRDPKAHGVGFVARLSGATAEWISMVLHMGLGGTPFRVVDAALRFEPRPLLADWLFTTIAAEGFDANSFGFKLFGHTWIVYVNPTRGATYGSSPVTPNCTTPTVGSRSTRVPGFLKL